MINNLKKVFLDKDYVKFNEDSYENAKSPLVERAKIISKFIKKNKIKSVLDIGCSTGGLASFLKKNNKNVQFYGCDLTQSVIEKIKKNPNLNYDNFFVDDVLNLKTKLKFDLILCFGVFQFIKNPFKILDSLKKNLNNNSFISISSQNFFYNFVSFNDISASFFNKVSNLKNKKFNKISKTFLKSNKYVVNNYFNFKYDNKEILNTFYLSEFFKKKSTNLKYLYTEYYNYHHNFLPSNNHKINGENDKWKKFFFSTATLHFFKNNKIIK